MRLVQLRCFFRYRGEPLHLTIIAVIKISINSFKINFIIGQGIFNFLITGELKDCVIHHVRCFSVKVVVMVLSDVTEPGAYGSAESIPRVTFWGIGQVSNLNRWYILRM